MGNDAVGAANMMEYRPDGAAEMEEVGAPATGIAVGRAVKGHHPETIFHKRRHERTQRCPSRFPSMNQKDGAIPLSPFVAFEYLLAVKDFKQAGTFQYGIGGAMAGAVAGCREKAIGQSPGSPGKKVAQRPEQEADQP